MKKTSSWKLLKSYCGSIHRLNFLFLVFVLLNSGAFIPPTLAQVSSPTSTAPKQTFSDVPRTHKHSVAIDYLSQQGIIKGYQEGTFKPEQLINRAEALKIIFIGKNIIPPSTVSEVSFTDIKSSDWFAPYVMKAKELNVITGNPDGTFAPGRTVSRAEFIKMLLLVNSFKPDKWINQQMFPDIPQDAWYTAYMNYAGQAGLLEKDPQNNLKPAQELTRGEVAEILYLMTVIRNGKDTQFLIDQSQAQMAQIEIYIAANNLVSAKRASELAVDITQQAYQNAPTNKVVLGAAKLGRAYDFLVDSLIAALQKRSDEAKLLANNAITKATEAWEANNDLQPIARHIKDLANQILSKLNGS